MPQLAVILILMAAPAAMAAPLQDPAPDICLSNACSQRAEIAAPPPTKHTEAEMFALYDRPDASSEEIAAVLHDVLSKVKAGEPGANIAYLKQWSDPEPGDTFRVAPVTTTSSQAAILLIGADGKPKGAMTQGKRR